MAAKFTAGGRNTGTRTVQKNPPPNVSGKSHTLERGNTMAGMPGYINAHQTESMDHARGGKGVGPKREGPIGERGGSGAKGMGKGEAACGTTTKSYRESSTRKAGGFENPSETGAHHVHTRDKGHRMPGQKAPPTAAGKIGGGHVRSAGIDHVKQGHAGRMEKLSGKARTHSEGRRKSVMY